MKFTRPQAHDQSALSSATIAIAVDIKHEYYNL